MSKPSYEASRVDASTWMSQVERQMLSELADWCEKAKGICCSSCDLTWEARAVLLRRLAQLGPTPVQGDVRRLALEEAINWIQAWGVRQKDGHYSTAAFAIIRGLSALAASPNVSHDS